MITECGISANGNKYCYYICERRKHGKGSERCRKQNVPKDVIEETVLAIVTQRIWNDYQIDEYVRAAKEAIRLHEEDPDIVRLKNEIKSHTEKKKRANNDKLSARLSSTYIYVSADIPKYRLSINIYYVLFRQST